MQLLVLGVILWSFTHFLPTAFNGTRNKMVAWMGEMPYKGLFSAVIVGSIVLMVFGWKSTVPQPLYHLGPWGHRIAGPIVFAGFLFFAAAQAPSNLRRLVRNPQLTGVCLWAIGHLVANGDSRSLVLFGGLLAWSTAQIVFSNRRDGAWERPAAIPASNDARLVVGTVVVYAIVVLVHPWLFNVRPY
jgi:uncharacterized membrane protein